MSAGKKERAVVVFPGRGSYGAAELGYLKQHHSGRQDLVDQLAGVVTQRGADDPRELDTLTKFSPAKHLPGRNASNLIYTCAMADFAAIDRDRFDIAAVCGNSLGWYLTLAAGGALSLPDGATLVDTMGGMMEREGVGGQILYPLTGEDWRADADLIALVQSAIAETDNAFLSIKLGGIVVIAGDDAAVSALMKRLPPRDDRFPLRLPKHAAFHTPLLANIAAKAQSELPASLFAAPSIPMIDGRGAIWRSGTHSAAQLHSYTLDTQIVETYDFSQSIAVALKEFAPDRVILAGPGGSLGPPLAHIMIEHSWLGITDRDTFTAQQQDDPFVIAMGRSDQRTLATG